MYVRAKLLQQQQQYAKKNEIIFPFKVMKALKYFFFCFSYKCVTYAYILHYFYFSYLYMFLKTLHYELAWMNECRFVSLLYVCYNIFVCYIATLLWILWKGGKYYANELISLSIQLSELVHVMSSWSNAYFFASLQCQL